MKRAAPAASADELTSESDPPAKRARGAAEEEADPLDAFMAEINDVVASQGAGGNDEAAPEAATTVRRGGAARARPLWRGRRTAARKPRITMLHAYSPSWPWMSSPTVWTPTWRRSRPMHRTPFAQAATRRRGVRASRAPAVVAARAPHPGDYQRAGAARS